MRIYVDSSALLKRVIEEPESQALEGFLDRHAGAGDVLVASSIAWIEVSRALGRLPALRSTQDIASIALSGVAEHRVTDEVVALARRIGPPMLRTLDALHLATAMLLDVERLLAYDERLIDACLANDLMAVSPGREDRRPDPDYQ